MTWGLLFTTALATFGGVAAWSGSAFEFLGYAAPEGPATATVQRGPLAIRLTERGQLESANNTTLRHKVENAGALTILKLVDEGSWVEAGEVVVQLDTSRLQTNAQRMQIYYFVHEAYRKTGEARLAMQKIQNESMIDRARHRALMAKLELQKWVDGDYPLRRTRLQDEVRVAEENLNNARRRLNFDEQMLLKGYSTTRDLTADDVLVGKAMLQKTIARKKLEILDHFIYRREVLQREATIKRWDDELARTELRAAHSLAQRQSELAYWRRWAGHFKMHHELAQRQIAACTIRAPHAGVVIHANTGINGGSFQPLIYQGVKVWEQQAIVHLPDVTCMQVSARIHESKVLMVREGQPVTVHVDAHSGETFHGVVEKVSLAPVSATWPKVDLKEYAAVIRITDEPDRVEFLKPGMSAEVTIHVDPLESVLQVPIQACFDRCGRHFAWVLDESQRLHRREIRVRTSNSEVIEIVGGLAEGEQVVLDPRSEIPQEVAQVESEISLADETTTIASAEFGDGWSPWDEFERLATEAGAEREAEARKSTVTAVPMPPASPSDASSQR